MSAGAKRFNAIDGYHHSQNDVWEVGKPCMIMVTRTHYGDWLNLPTQGDVLNCVGPGWSLEILSTTSREWGLIGPRVRCEAPSRGALFQCPDAVASGVMPLPQFEQRQLIVRCCVPRIFVDRQAPGRQRPVWLISSQAKAGKT